MNLNPWLVESLEAFSFLCCPECVYRSKEANSFQVHAMQNHPQSLALFCGAETDFVKHESSSNDVKDSSLSAIDKTDLDDLKLDELQDNKNDLDLDLSMFSGEDDEEEEDDPEDDPEDDDFKYERKGKRKRSSTASNISKSYDCSFCAKEFKKRSDMRLHMRTVHTDVQCDECDKKFENPAKLTKHKYLKHKEIECKECNKSYSPAVFTRHMKTVHVSKDNRTFTCDMCPFKSHAQRYLSEHKTNFHSGKVKPERTARNLVKKESSDTPEIIVCPACGKSLKSKTFVVHYRKAHGCLPPGYKDGKRFICDQCSVEYASMQSLKKHTESAHGEGTEHPKEYRCHQCSQDFTGFHYLLIHFRHVHKDIPPEYKDSPQFICDQCPDIFLSEAHLKGHISRKHSVKVPAADLSSEGPIKSVRKQCPNCEKTFGGYNALREHILVKHENNTPHQCDQCPRKFGLSHTLRVHQKYVHTKVRCDVCNEEVCNSFVLKRHKAAVHGIVPPNSLKCQLCPMFFHTKKSLQNHMGKKHA